MSNSIIRAAIEGRLKTWATARAPAMPTAFENVGYTPVLGTAYLRGFLMPANTKNQSIGGKHKGYHGMYQVSLHFPEGQGTGDVEAAAKEIEALFESPTTIVRQGRNVNVTRTPAIAMGMPDEAGFFMVPVTIWYEMDDFS